jgi:hypothetical protein
VPIRAQALIVLLSSVIFSKITASVAVGLALCAATVRLPASPCILSNASSPVYRCVLADPRTPVNAKVFLGLAPGLVEERLLLAVEAQKIS